MIISFPPIFVTWVWLFICINWIDELGREECACNPVRFFSILTMQRSGSGWFETLLNSHINVSSNGEIFNVAKRMENVSSILKTMDKVYNLDWFTSASKNECSAAVGYKWMLNQVGYILWPIEFALACLKCVSTSWTISIV